MAVLLPVALLWIGYSVFAAEEAALPGGAEQMGMVSHMVGDQVVLRCERFELRFAANGQPLSFLL